MPDDKLENYENAVQVLEQFYNISTKFAKIGMLPLLFWHPFLKK